MSQNISPLSRLAKAEVVLIAGTLPVLLSLAIMACTPEAPEPLSLTPTLPTVTPLPPVILPTNTPTPAALTPTTHITLTLWTTEAFSPTHTITSGQILQDQLDGFLAQHPNLSLNIVLKKPYGDGGILSFLRAAHVAAPSVLPDVAILDAAELPQAVGLGLVQPMEGLVSPALYGNLYPFGLQVSQINGHVMGIPFQADMEHLIYNTGRVARAPLVWSDVLSGSARYIFPAGGDGGLVNDAFLTQYFALGGRFSDPDGKPVLDRDVVRQVLNYYMAGRELKVIPPTILKFQRTADCWETYVTGQAAMAHVNTRLYLSERDRLHSSAFAPIPTEDGAVVTVAHTWVFVLVTDDPARQQIASWLLEWLLDPARNAAWNLAVGSMPPNRQAIASLVNTGDPYFLFMEGQLSGARPYPSNPKYPEIARALQKAVEAVLTGAASPEEATDEAITTVGLK